MGDWVLIIDERDLGCDDGDEVGFDVVAMLDTLDFATCWWRATFLSPYLNDTGMLDGLVAAGRSATPVPARRVSIESLLSDASDGVGSYGSELPLT